MKKLLGLTIFLVLICNFNSLAAVYIPAYGKQISAYKSQNDITEEISSPKAEIDFKDNNAKPISENSSIGSKIAPSYEIIGANIIWYDNDLKNFKDSGNSQTYPAENLFESLSIQSGQEYKVSMGEFNRLKFKMTVSPWKTKQDPTMTIRTVDGIIAKYSDFVKNEIDDYWVWTTVPQDLYIRFDTSSNDNESVLQIIKPEVYKQ